MLTDFCITANAIASTTKGRRRNVQESARHKSGYALRFPRIAHIRYDKTVEQISTIDEVRRIYEGQLKRERQE